MIAQATCPLLPILFVINWIFLSGFEQQTASTDLAAKPATGGED
jgi:hypothetical protein